MDKIIFFVLFPPPSPVPPDRISIRDESGIDRVSVVGPYSEGDFVNLNCDVFGGTYEFPFK